MLLPLIKICAGFTPMSGLLKPCPIGKPLAPFESESALITESPPLATSISGSAVCSLTENPKDAAIVF